MTKLLSKKEIKEYLLRAYNNDERITDELLFDGKRLTVKAYNLLRFASCADNSVENHYKQNDIMDKVGYHIYFPWTMSKTNVGGSYDAQFNNNYLKKEMQPKIEKICKRLESMVKDDECYFISDCIWGDREKTDNFGCGNFFSRWRSDESTILIDVWLFAECGNVAEMLEDNASKWEVLMESNI